MDLRIIVKGKLTHLPKGPVKVVDPIVAPSNLIVIRVSIVIRLTQLHVSVMPNVIQQSIPNSCSKVEENSPLTSSIS